MQLLMKNSSAWTICCISVSCFVCVLLNLSSIQAQSSVEETAEFTFGEFLDKVESGEIMEVTIRGHDIGGISKDGRSFKTYTTEYPDLVKILRQTKVKITVKHPETDPWYLQLLLSWGPFIILLLLWRAKFFKK